MNAATITIISVVVIAVIVFVVNRIIVAHNRQVSAGREDLIGKTATVRTQLAPRGNVFYKGELWQATLDKDQAEPGEKVIITSVKDLELFVTKTRTGE